MLAVITDEKLKAFTQDKRVSNREFYTWEVVCLSVHFG